MVQQAGRRSPGFLSGILFRTLGWGDISRGSKGDPVSGFWSVRRVTVGAVFMAMAVGATCLLAQTVPGGAPAISAPPATPPNPSLAFINGKEVNREAFDAIMIQVAGMRVFDQILNLTIVQQACINGGIPMSGKEYSDRIQAEIDKTLDSFTLPAPAPGAAPLSKDEEKKQRTMILGQVLQQRGVTAVEWRMGLETSAGLRALAKDKVAATTDKEADTAWESQYGERRGVHIMVLPADNNEAATMAGKYRQMIADDKKTPEQAAAELKQGAPASWTISKNATEVPDIRQVTFESLKKPGDISAITTVHQAGQPDQKVIILLDKIEEDRKNANPNNAAMHQEMKDKVYTAKEQAWMNNQLQILRGNATVDIKDPVLADQYKQLEAQRQANAAAATAATSGPSGTAPAGTAPAPMSGMPAATNRAMPPIGANPVTGK